MAIWIDRESGHRYELTPDEEELLASLAAKMDVENGEYASGNPRVPVGAIIGE